MKSQKERSRRIIHGLARVAHVHVLGFVRIRSSIQRPVENRIEGITALEPIHGTINRLFLQDRQEILLNNIVKIGNGGLFRQPSKRRSRRVFPRNGGKLLLERVNSLRPIRHASAKDERMPDLRGTFRLGKQHIRDKLGCRHLHDIGSTGIGAGHETS